jgi:hypothetical protein
MGVTTDPNQQVDRLFPRLTSQDSASPEIPDLWASGSRGPNHDSVTTAGPVQRARSEHGNDHDEFRPVADIGED